MPRASRPDPVASENPPLRFALQYVDATHPYLISRGVTRRDDPHVWSRASTPGRVCFAGRIVIPIHNAVRRADRLCRPRDRRPRTEVSISRPASASRSSSLICIERSRQRRGPSIVVEGFFDTIAVHQAGYPVVGPHGLHALAVSSRPAQAATSSRSGSCSTTIPRDGRAPPPSLKH